MKGLVLLAFLASNFVVTRLYFIQCFRGFQGLGVMSRFRTATNFLKIARYLPLPVGFPFALNQLVSGAISFGIFLLHFAKGKPRDD